MLKKALLACSVIFFSFNAMALNTALINGREIKNREELHAVFAKQLNFPHFYGKTLESLYDNLSTTYSKDSVIKIKNINLLKVKLGTEYIDSMIQAIMDASNENDKIVLVLE